MRVGKLLRKCRIESGKTQDDIASSLGLTTAQFISNIERGLCSPSPPTIKAYVDLAKAPLSDVIELMVKEYRVDLFKKVRGD